MERKTHGHMQCPIARSLEQIGERWTILILRDAFFGLTRFEQFEASLGIAPNMLVRRLKTLVQGGLMERHLYQTRPPRHEYVLTERGRDFRFSLLTLATGGNRHFAPEGRSIDFVDPATGRSVDPILVDRDSRVPLSEIGVRVVAGPAADARTRRRLGSSPSV